MKTFSRLFIFLTLAITLISCEKKYKFNIEIPEKIKVSEPFSVQITEENQQTYDSVQITFNNASVKVGEKIELSHLKLGQHPVKATVYYDGKQKELTRFVTLLADKAPEIYHFKIINTYPHDVNAYTQGLEYHNGFLYESTGQNGASTLRKVELKTGKVLQKIDLPATYFGEGMTIFDDKIIQLTWRNKLGIVYNLSDFKEVKTFDYNQSQEGWGLTHNGKHLIKTDGTERIWFLDPETQKEQYFIEAYTNEQMVENLNELEYVDGKIYANVYQKNIILIVNPDNGAIEGIADMSELEQLVSQSQSLVKGDEVLNGIAYDEPNKRLFVTGKHWGKLFEIQLEKR